MKELTLKVCSVVLAASILTSTPALLTANAESDSASGGASSTSTEFTESDSAVLFSGETGLEGNGLKGSARVIETVDEYYEILGNKIGIKSSGAELTEISTNLPESVDNSQSKYFPEIGHQGSLGSCVSWAQTYYQFTYEMNRDMDIETTPENTFSPKWTHNIANGGKEDGSWEDDVYDVMLELGTVTIADLPVDDDYLSWSPYEDIWKTAAKYRISDYQIFQDIGIYERTITSNDDPDLGLIKTALSNGEVLAVTTYVYDFDFDNLKTNSSAPENDKFAGEYVVTNLPGNKGRHRMALVGYNDNIWTDINGNDKVDSGEMGAFKIANSWGTDYANDGFTWVAYDALNKASCVEGGENAENRRAVFEDVTRIDVVPYDTDSSIYLKYTLNSCDRSQTKLYITAEKDGVEYSIEGGPKRDHGMYNSTYSYDGTLESNDGTMIYPLSNVVPGLTCENLTEYTWSVRFEDTTADGKIFTVKNAEIVDESTGKVCRPDNVFPFKLDGNEKTVEYSAAFKYNILGDADCDGKINSVDVLLIQRYDINLADSSDISLETADCNQDGTVSLRDATCIQRYMVSYSNCGYVGNMAPGTIPDDSETDTDSEQETDTDSDNNETNTVTFTNSFNWSGTLSCYYWSDSNKNMTSWPGEAMTQSGTDDSGKSLYTFEMPDDATYVIFTNGSSQTVDISYSGGEVHYCPKSSTDSQGHYEVNIVN